MISKELLSSILFPSLFSKHYLDHYIKSVDHKIEYSSKGIDQSKKVKKKNVLILGSQERFFSMLFIAAFSKSTVIEIASVVPASLITEICFLNVVFCDAVR